MASLLRCTTLFLLGLTLMLLIVSGTIPGVIVPVALLLVISADLLYTHGRKV